MGRRTSSRSFSGRSQSPRGRSRTRSTSKGRGRSRSSSRKNSRSRGPTRRGRRKTVFVRRSSRSRSRSRVRGGVVSGRGTVDKVSRLMGKKSWGDISAIINVDYSTSRRDFALESGDIDVNAEIKKGCARFFVASGSLNTKIASLSAKEVMQKSVSVSFDFVGCQREVYGFIYVLVGPAGKVDPEFEDIVENDYVKKYEWSKCPKTITVAVPAVKPWEPHIPKIPQESQMAICVATEVKRTAKDLANENVVCSMVAHFIYSGEFRKE